MRSTFETVLPFLRATQLLGLMPCGRLHASGRLQASKDLALFLGSFFVFFVSPAGFYYLYENFSQVGSEKDWNGAFLYCIILSNVLHFVFLLLYAWYFIAKICSVVTKVFDAFRIFEKVTRVSLEKYQTALRIYQIGGLIVSLSISLSFVIRFSGESNWQIQILLNFTRMQMFAVEQTIVVFNFIFALYFRHICKIPTKKCKKVQMTKLPRSVWTTTPISPTSGLRECFSTLSDALATLQREVSLFLLLDVLQLTVNIVAFLAFIIVKGMQKNRSLTFLIIFVDSIIRIVVLTFSCGQVADEVQSVAEAASCAINSALDENTKDELRMLMDEARCRQLKFWALGFFTVDRPLLFSIFGSAISYLIVISQLQKEE